MTTPAFFELNPTGAISLERASLYSDQPKLLPWFATSVSASISAVWNERFADLRRLRGLEQDWDGEDAAAVDVQAINSAEAILDNVKNNLFHMPPSRVDALANGSVLIIWNCEPAGYFEAEISSSNKIELMYFPRVGKAEHLTVAQTAPPVQSEIPEMTSFQRADTVSGQVYSFGT